MAKKVKNKSCCASVGEMGCCSVESVITVDERGQMVLPKEIRDKAKIHAGDKLAVISWGKDKEIYCISLIKSEGFAAMVKDLLGPMMKEIVRK